MNKRDLLLNLIEGQQPSGYTPAAFFMHFDPAYHQGQAAIDKHLEFFRYTGMDFVKIQFEQRLPPGVTIRTPQDWAHARLYPQEAFDVSANVARGLVEAAGKEALVLMTLYSPLMWAARAAETPDLLVQHMHENPEAVKKGLDIMTENVLKLVRACKQAGVDGFYASTQGGEDFRFGGSPLFTDYIKPTDLAVWAELQSCTFNILHVCDFEGGYTDYTPFLDYPGQVVNCSLKLGERTLTPDEAAKIFGRPFMGGMERKGIIASGAPQEIRRAAQDVLTQAPQRFILAADCTVPSETRWENLKAAIDAAHNRG
ncbi:MAG: uroporphyrinogen decarboxylase family protein [Anaerolineales bacterium]